MSQTIPRVAYRGPREHQERPSKLQERVTEAAQRTRPTRRAKRAASMQTEKHRPVVPKAEGELPRVSPYLLLRCTPPSDAALSRLSSTARLRQDVAGGHNLSLWWVLAEQHTRQAHL